MPNLKIAEKEIRELASGRLWVSARLSSSPSLSVSELWVVLNDLKGAYQEDTAGVYYQPAPSPNDPGVQHRLRKLNGFWVIEALDLEQRLWRLCTKELPNRKW